MNAESYNPDSFCHTHTGLFISLVFIGGFVAFGALILLHPPHRAINRVECHEKAITMCYRALNPQDCYYMVLSNCMNGGNSWGSY